MLRKEIIDDSPKSHADTDTNEQETVFHDTEFSPDNVDDREGLENHWVMLGLRLGSYRSVSTTTSKGYSLLL